MTSSADRFWDERYSQPGYLYGTEPNAFLRSQAWRFPAAGAALSVADGEGRNGVFLAESGLAVTTVDGAAVGVEKARALARQRGVDLRAEHADLFAWDWPEAAFDLAVSIFLHLPEPERRLLHRHLVRALKPGGLLLLQAYRPDQIGRGTGGPPDRALTYTADLLSADFADLQRIELLEGEAWIEEGSGHRGMSAVIHLVARKPG